MKKLTQIFVASLALAVMPSLVAGEVFIPAKAPVADEPNNYAFAYGGYSFGLETNSIIPNLGDGPGDSIPGPGDNIPARFQADVDAGFIIGAGAGLYSDLFGGSRFEFEALYSSSDYESITLFGPTNVTVPLGGQMETKGFFLNVLKEIPLSKATAYAGGGFGFATVEASLVLDGPGGPGDGPPLGLSNQDTTLAYQLKAGVDSPVSDRVAIFGEYKLIGVADLESSVFLFPQETEGFVSNHFVVGARVSF